MDGYPAGSLDHNVPFLVVSGLGTASTKHTLEDPGLREQGILVRSELPSIESREAKIILRCIQEKDATSLPWNSRDTSRRYKFKIETIGREFLLPPRRARLPDNFEAPPSPPILHSPFSPLSPGSTLYPDGLIDTRWLQKHQEFIPSVYLTFYSLTSDPTLATLHDNQLKTDINAVKNAIAQSGYKTRFVAVILSDQSPSSVGQFQERLENVRRSTGLDPKASLFVLPTQRTEADLDIAVDSVLSAVFDQAAEYYRDLGRHSRKKKSRGIAPQPTIPPTTGTSHTLSLQGWNVRYDFKTAVFAEFRQEIDTAQRSYEQAYDTLLGADVLETIPGWSPRFNDSRLLADILAIRILKCLLWTGQSTSAVKRWQAHHDRIFDLVDRRGRGTQNYGWKAWEARWSTVMANLIEKVQFPELDPSVTIPYRLPEKNLSAERLQPWEFLHHQGYWYRMAARHLSNRRKLALSIPEDDRKPPDTTSPSQPSKAYVYDTYMCPEPHEEYPLVGTGVNHSQLIYDHLTLARREFQKRLQLRTSTELALECSKELERLREWKQILGILTPLWRNMSFRKEGWWDIMEALSWTLRGAAVEANRKDLVIAIDWELLNRGFSRRPGWHYDITKSLDDIDEDDDQPDISISDELITSFLQASFIFKNEEGKAGQNCVAQLAISSNAFPDAAPVEFEEIRVQFDGSLRPIHLKHKASNKQTSASPKLRVTKVALSEVEPSNDADSDDASEISSQTITTIILEGTDDLTLLPGQTRVFEIDVPLREPGDAEASSVQVSVAPESFDLKYTIHLRETNSVGLWYSPTSSRKRVTRINPHRIKVLPRPPKMEVKLIKMLEQYYANEHIPLELELFNEEDADANTKLDVVLYGDNVPSYKVQIENGAEKSSSAGVEESKLEGVSVGTIPNSKSIRAKIIIEPVDGPMVFDLMVKARYHLVSDPATPIIQQENYNLNIVNPFEASYDLSPRLHSEWPNYFNPEDIHDSSEGNEATRRPRGLAQKWSLATRYASFAQEDLAILGLDVNILSTQGNVTCKASTSQPSVEPGMVISPKVIEEARFELIAQKFDLDDRSPATADLAFIIKWRRLTSSKDTINTTSLPLPRFFITTSEPRVLASVSYYSPPDPSSSPLSPRSPTKSKSKPASLDPAPQLLFLDVTIENPSAHFLTFGLMMEPSDEFAFSGAKATTLNVLPVARRSVTYRLLPLVRGAWVRPTLVVRDKYFQKVLKIIPTEGMKTDRDGVLVWVSPEEEGEDDGEEGDGEKKEDGKKGGEEEEENEEDDDDDEDEDEDESDSE
ncbi:Gryzun, putative trafficking through golgi-domain-containing protein [Hypoxylon trugodes]|uniref:Gryzun, putative trafficking through golgi-domain-containing protein n=1 Tax=Hypoxylon trugodes TaxID=326681 RepID=UPI002199D9BF|nr:Gryzun, putative trafficking through golgi-domain-containing protein [Hypoxylon trugodes]KAI1387421.1 Gryzun, putative trafficking through golgi-domain-containing protein [Hypoxylon trugodes]